MRLFWAVTLIVVASIGCGDEEGASNTSASSGSGGGETCTVDTSYDPKLVPGTTFVYQAGEETVNVTVTTDTKVILGVTCTIVHDVATVAGSVIEDTFDWFAQDAEGAVWYFGEDTKELNSNGDVVSTKGSWEAGVDGAKPGIVIPASPTVGQQYRQEYYACTAEDMGEVLALDASADVPAGSYSGCLKTRDTTPLEPSVEEEKYYCPGKGLVLSVDTKSGEREELMSFVTR
jgi:hypothetical protein